MAVELARWRFTVADYHRMGEAGISGEDHRVELIDGEIVRMSPIGGPHMGCVNRLTELFVQRLADVAVVSVQNPVTVGDHSEPQPDIATLRRRDDFYASGPPTPDDVLLLVEVADSSLGYDRTVKVRLYARAGIPEVWIADLGGRLVLAHRDPTPDGYRTLHALRPGETLSPGAFPDLQIAVGGILG